MAAPEILELLSEREAQVFVRVTRGDTTVSISRELALSESTVRTYKRRVLHKCRCHSIAELMAANAGLVEQRGAP